MNISEQKISYNPFNKDFVESNYLHSNDLRDKSFYEYIRATIINDILYIRAYYPYEQLDIQDFTLQELYQKSTKILDLYIEELLQELKNRYNYIPNKTVYNADKDLLRQNVL